MEYCNLICNLFGLQPDIKSVIDWFLMGFESLYMTPSVSTKLRGSAGLFVF